MEKFEVIQDTGYGLVPRKIMRDKNLSAEAKAIYSYLASFAGNTGQAFPSTSLMSSELNMSRNRLFKYLKELKDKKAISVKREKGEKGQFGKNIYYLHNSIKKKEPCIQNPYMGNPDMDIPDMENKDTNSNSLNSNSFNKYLGMYKPDENLKEMVSLFENNIGMINSLIAEQLVDLSKDIESKLFKEAIKIASDKNKCNFGYVKGICNNWIANNIKTLKDLEAYKVSQKNNKKEIKEKEKAEVEEQEEHNPMNDFLKEFQKKMDEKGADI